jgi:tetratricopeptide (TPR) repeat protein
MLRVCFALLFNLQLNVALAQTETSEELFQKGLAAYQAKQYDQAKASFEKIAQMGPTSARLLHNLALTHFQLNQKGYAVAYWRKALVLDPAYQPARAGRDLMETRMNMRAWERDPVSSWLRHTLEPISIHHLLWLIALVLGCTGFMWIRYSAERRSALQQDLPLPAWPWPAALLAAVFVGCLGLLALKVNFSQALRATVVAEKAQVRSLPADDGTALFELNSGSEVLVRREEEAWMQVQTREGGSGWVRKVDVMQTAER